MRLINTREENLELAVIADKISMPAVALEPAAQAEVIKIVRRVFEERDEAVVEYSRDKDWTEASAATLRVSEAEIRAAAETLDAADAAALRAAIEHVREFHQQHVPGDHLDAAEYGALLGWRYTPIESVGVYVPAGTAPLPSSLIMAVVPAQAAGVSRIAVVTPPARDGSANPGILAAAGLLGITEVYRVGGPWAIAALARGTQTIPAVDKIVGPGNIYVNFAKSAVAGVVGIDGFYGPSEVVILADEQADPRLIAADLAAQAEHASDSIAVLVTPSRALMERVEASLAELLRNLGRADTIRRCLDERGAMVLVRSLEEGIELVNLVAPEHLELAVADPRGLLPKIRNAGCILVGADTPTAVSDYLAGPSHILPTGRSARFSSGLGVLDFMKRSSVVSVSPEWLAHNGRHVERLAEMEGLQAHARSVRMRMGDDG
ncbi:MAG TPA: histidinol dehydrogenase [Armatimonadota bacterium]|nr:histidinol dehydrogenase [Armatimonadota bacterium]